MTDEIPEGQPASPTKPDFHSLARERLYGASVEYGERVGALAQALALGEDAAEVQPGHVTRAQNDFDRSRRRKSLGRRVAKGFLQMFGSVMFGAGFAAVVSNLDKTIADVGPYIIVGLIGVAAVLVGLMIDD